jgi:predicted nucleic acid-binding protein
MTVTGYAGRIESMPDCDISDTLIFPAISIFEVFKVVIRETDENKSLLAIAAMQKGSVLVLNAKIAMDASLLSIQHHLPMADSIILATARADN